MAIVRVKTDPELVSTGIFTRKCTVTDKKFAYSDYDLRDRVMMLEEIITHLSEMLDKTNEALTKLLSK